MLTIPLRIPSTSASEASLKETSQTLIIFCKSSSKPISLLSSEISAPWPFIQARSSSACSSRLMSMNTGTFILNRLSLTSGDLGVVDVGGAEIALGSDPVR